MQEINKQWASKAERLELEQMRDRDVIKNLNARLEEIQVDARRDEKLVFNSGNTQFESGPSKALEDKVKQLEEELERQRKVFEKKLARAKEEAVAGRAADNSNAYLNDSRIINVEYLNHSHAASRFDFAFSTNTNKKNSESASGNKAAVLRAEGGTNGTNAQTKEGD